MDWKPDPAGLSQLIQLLKDAMSPNNVVRQQVQQQLSAFMNNPDYNNYLAYIFTFMTDVDAAVRANGGLQLKNNVRNHYQSFPPPTREYITACAFQALTDAQDIVKATAGTILTTIVSNDASQLSQILPKLMELIENPDIRIVEGAFGALAKICEDSARTLHEDPGNALYVILPKFISFFASPSIKVRVAAINCVNQFVLLKSEALMNNMETYVNALYQRTSDQSEDVRKAICAALVMILEVRSDILMAQLPNVIEFMLYCTREGEEEVALEACEFWLAFAEQDELQPYLQPYLPKLIPVLLKGMVYSEEDIAILDVGEDANVPDRDQDIRPQHYKAKTHKLDFTTDPANPAVTNSNAPNSNSNANPSGSNPEEEDDEDDFDDEEDDDDVYGEWNLRKCSAAALDVLATVFGNSLLEVLLPLLKEELFHAEWERRECGILALGAIAEGCIQGMEPHLPTLVPHLTNTLNDAKPLVRSITCWTLGRYSRWIVHPPANQGMDLATHKKQYFEPLVLGLLKMILDNNKRVQEAACSAFATLEEEAQTELVPYLLPVLQALSHAFTKYQHKNLLILYDAVGTLADSVGQALNTEEYINIIMPPLIQKWRDLPDDSRDLFPLLECLSSIATALGHGFLRFAPPVWQRCLNLVHSNLQRWQLKVQYPDQYELDQDFRDFMIVALDLLSGVAQGLNTAVEPLVGGSNPPLLPMLAICMKDPVAEVRQSAYALLGDLAISAFPHIKPHLHAFLPELVTQIDPNTEPVNLSVCNNAAWAAGEIALQYGSEMAPFVNPLLQRLIPLLTSQSTIARTLVENAAITIGRLGVVCPEVVAPHLGTIAMPWCVALSRIRDNLEKESAFLGFCKMIEANPTGLIKDFVYFCDAVLRWERTSPELNEYFRKLLTGYKGMMGEQWGPYVATFPERIREGLQQR
ncbi:hypothetical protein HK102_005027, partial [Quaeritorhiza haematococci]